MNLHDNHLETHRQELVARLERDRAELIRATQNLQPSLRALDHAEQRVRQAAEALPVIAWGLAELTLAGVAIRWAIQLRTRGWLVLGFQAFRAFKALRDAQASGSTVLRRN